jgi:hypothetical protein
MVPPSSVGSASVIARVTWTKSEYFTFSVTVFPRSASRRSRSATRPESARSLAPHRLPVLRSRSNLLVPDRLRLPLRLHAAVVDPARQLEQVVAVLAERAD